MYSRREWFHQIFAGAATLSLAGCRQGSESGDAVLSSSVGALRQPVADCLLADCTAVIGYPIDSTHYREFFCWRSRTFQGYRSLYERYRSDLDAGARAGGTPAFVDCSVEQRLQIHDKVVPPAPRFFRLSHRVPNVKTAAALRPAYHRHIELEVLWLFYKTDAWLVSGYDDWPGTPRGLQGYPKRPRRGS